MAEEPRLENINSQRQELESLEQKLPSSEHS